MKATPVRITYRVEIVEGEQPQLPEALLRAMSGGKWLITVEPEPEDDAIRHYDAFLRSYAEEDEGLYDDLAQAG